MSMSVTIRNPRVDAPPDPPQRPSGGLYRFEMIHDGGKWRTYAHTAVDLVDALIPGYRDLATPSGQTTARIAFATQAQVALQAVLNTDDAMNDCTDQQRDVLLAPRHTPPAPETWDAPVPLVLVTAFYQPAGATPPPSAAQPDALIWLDPGSDWSLLRSLHAGGLVHLASTDTLPGPDGSDAPAPPRGGDR